MMTFLILVAVLVLAYSNGANDNFKGVATLFGSGTTTYRKALVWATVTTFAGSMLALVLAHGLINAFKGKGLVPDAIIANPTFLLAVSLGAGMTILLATLTGLPVSTTHGLTGALVGAGLIATGGDIKWAALGTSFVLPLIGSPLLSMILTLSVYPAFRWMRQRFGIARQSCVCVGSVCEVGAQPCDSSLAVASLSIAVQTGEIKECRERYHGEMLGLQAGSALDSLHYLSAGAVGFARGLNDTPKIVAILIGASAVSPNIGLVLVAVAMAVGGILNARRVAETISHKITAMSPGQGFTANLITSLMVVAASRFGFPVSTTHVSVGSLFAIGTVNGTAKWSVIGTILLAWVTTLPMGALFAAVSYWMVNFAT